MKFKEGDKVRISKEYMYEEIAGKIVIIDHIDNGHDGDAYFILDRKGISWYEVSEEMVEKI